MRDETLRELLRSPLEDIPERRAGWVAFVAAFALAAAVGVGGGLAANALRSEGDAEVVAETTTTTSAVTETTEAAGRPIPVSAAGDARVSAEWVYEGDDAILVGVSSVVEPGADSDEALGVGTARWLLRAADGGRTVPFLSERAWLAAQGMFTIEFPPSAASIPYDTLLVLPMTETVEETATWSVAADTLPHVYQPEDPEIEVEGVRVVIDEIRLDDTGGNITWHVAGGEEVRVRLAATVRYEDLDAGTRQRSVIDSDIPSPFLQLTVPVARPARSGVLQLYRLDDSGQPTFRSRYTGDAELAVAVQDIEIEWSIMVFRYADEAVEVSLDGVTRFPKTETE